MLNDPKIWGTHLKRREVVMLIRRLNHEKNIIKERGLSVDGTCYKIKFVGSFFFFFFLGGGGELS